MTKFAKNVKWLEPFYLAAKDLIPANRIQRVIGYKTAIGQTERSDGGCVKTGRKYTITVRTHTKELKTQKALYIEYMLVTFAHELAHTVYWDHDPRHFQLTAKILNRFVKPLKELKIEDTTSRVHPRIE